MCYCMMCVCCWLEVAGHPEGGEISWSSEAQELHRIQRMLPQGTHCMGEHILLINANYRCHAIQSDNI